MQPSAPPGKPVLSLSSAGMCCVVENTTRLLDDLAQGQHQHRASVTWALTEGLSPEDAHVIGVGKEYLASVRRQFKNGSFYDTELMTDKARSVKRPRGKDRIDHASGFLKETTAVPQSGDKKEVYRSFISISAAWKEYLITSLTSDSNFNPAGFKHFKKAWKALGIQKSNTVPSISFLAQCVMELRGRLQSLRSR